MSSTRSYMDTYNAVLDALHEGLRSGDISFEDVEREVGFGRGQVIEILAFEYRPRRDDLEDLYEFLDCTE